MKDGKILKLKVIHKVKNIINKIIGYLMTAQGLLNIILGFTFGFGSNFVILAIILPALFISIYLILLILNRYKEKNQYNLLKNMDNYPSEMIKFSKQDVKQLEKDYVLYDNYVVDVSEFINNHPGGKIHLQESLRGDITRFITGSVAINHKFTPHKHSFLANKHIISKLSIGVIYENHKLFINKSFM